MYEAHNYMYNPQMFTQCRCPLYLNDRALLVIHTQLYMSPRLVPSLWACSNVGLSAGFDLALLVTRIAEVLMPSSGTHLESPLYVQEPGH